MVVWLVVRVEEVKEVVRSSRPWHGGWVAVAMEGGGGDSKGGGGSGLGGKALVP